VYYKKSNESPLNLPCAKEDVIEAITTNDLTETYSEAISEFQPTPVQEQDKHSRESRDHRLSLIPGVPGE
jgi:hypothetical protein